MILYRLISWPYFRKHLVRTGLTVTGIILGVAVFVGMHSANQAVLAAFYKTADRIAGATQLQVTAGDSGFAEEVLERVQAVRGVRVAAPVIEAVVNTGLPGQGNVMILAVDLTGDRSLRDYDLESGDDAIVEDPLVFLAQPDSLIVTEEFAARNALRNNSRIPMQTMDGPKQFTVRGIMKSGGLTTAFGGNLAIMDVYAAQAVFGRGRRFDRIDLAVNEGVRIEDVQSSIRQALGDGFEVQPPASRGQQFESISVMYSVTANISSVFALLVGLFIIYNTFAIAVTQRRSEIGILRALGATRGQIRTLFLGEGAITGLIGSGLGVLLGIVISRGIAGSLAGFLETVYGVANRVEEVGTNPRLVSLALAMGVVTSLIAALVPARNAAQVDPVQALQKGKYQLLTAGENRRRRIAGTICFLASLAALAASRVHFFFYLGYLLSVTAALLFAPTFSLYLSRLLRPVLRKLRPVEGTLAADSLIQSPRRTSGAVSALMLSLSLVIAIGGLARASYNSIVDWMDTTLDPDLFVGPTEQVTDRSFLFPPSIGDEIERMDGVGRVQRVRSIRLPFRGGPVLVVAVEVGRLSDPAKRRVLGGDPDTIYRRAAAGEGVIVSENLALLHDLSVGETIEIPAPSGILRLPILGIAEDYSDQKGTVMMDRGLYMRHWKDDRVNLFRVYLNKGVDSSKVREQILARFAGERKLFVFTNERLREYVLKITGQWFGLTYIQVGVAILVAVLGIVNTMTVSISDRRREIGVLQAVGGLRNQVRSTVWIEAVAVGMIALVCGCGLGAVTLFFSIVLAVPDMAGLRLPYQYPLELASVLVPLILAAAFLSSVGPAETAVRRSLVEALEYE